MTTLAPPPSEHSIQRNALYHVPIRPLTKPPRLPRPHHEADTTTADSTAEHPKGAETPNIRYARTAHTPSQRLCYPPHSRSNSQIRGRSVIQDLNSNMYTPQMMSPMRGSVQDTWSRIRMLGDITLEFIDTSPFIGRGGAIQFFLLAFSIRHKLTPQLPDGDLTKQKDALRIKKGGLVIPQWPVCYHQDFPMIEPNAVIRYLASQIGLYGNDPLKDYQGDMLLDKVACWRDHLSAVLGEFVDGFQKNDMSSPSVQEYFKSIRRNWLAQFEALLTAADSAFFLGEQISWVDPTIMSVLYEDLTLAWQAVKEGGVAENEDHPLSLLEKYPKCLKFIDSVKNVSPLLAAWMEDHKRTHFPQEVTQAANDQMPPAQQPSIMDTSSPYQSSLYNLGPADPYKVSMDPRAMLNSLGDPRAALGDPRGTMLADPRAMVADPRAMVADPRAALGDPRMHMYPRYGSRRQPSRGLVPAQQMYSPMNAINVPPDLQRMYQQTAYWTAQSPVNGHTRYASSGTSIWDP